jgi:hypothetical protein
LVIREIVDKLIRLGFYKASQNEKKPKVEKRASAGEDEYKRDLIMRANYRCANAFGASMLLVF